jgi:hypothetical protein
MFRSVSLLFFYISSHLSSFLHLFHLLYFFHRLFLSSVICSSSLFPVCSSSVFLLVLFLFHIEQWQHLLIFCIRKDVVASADREDRCVLCSGALPVLVESWYWFLVLQSIIGTWDVHYRCADCNGAACVRACVFVCLFVCRYVTAAWKERLGVLYDMKWDLKLLVQKVSAERQNAECRSP